MKAISAYSALWLSFAAVATYLAGYYAIGSASMKLLIDTLLLGVGVIISWSWGPAAWRAIRRGASGDVSKIVLTVWLAWTTLVIQRIWVIWLGLAGRPQWAVDSPVSGIITTLIFIAGMYAVVAPITGTEVPKREIIHLIVAVALGGVIAGIAIALVFMRSVAG